MRIFKKIEVFQTSYMQGLTHAEEKVQEWKNEEPKIDPQYLYERLTRSVLSAWPIEFQAGYKDFASHIMRKLILKK